MDNIIINSKYDGDIMKYLLYFALIYTVFATSLFSQKAFQENGLSIVYSSKIGVTTLGVKGYFDKQFTVVYYNNEDIPNDLAKRVLYLKQFPNNFKDIKYGDLKFFINSIGGVEANITIRSFIYNGVDYARYIPAGIVMRYDNRYITYEVQAIKNKNRHRIFGIYSRETDMIMSIVSALEDPINYAKKTDPAYLSAQVIYLTEELRRTEKLMILMSQIKISAKNYQSTLSYIHTVVMFKERNPYLSYEEMTVLLKAERLPIKRDLILAVFRIYFNDFDSDKQKTGSLRVPNPLSEP